MLKTLKTKSSDTKAEGSIAKSVIQTPKAHHKLKSLEDFLSEIFMIKGMFHNGKMSAAINPKSLITDEEFTFLHLSASNVHWSQPQGGQIST